MPAELDERLREIARLREEGDRLARRVPTVQEELGKERYQLAAVQDELARVAAEIDALSSLTPASLLAGLFGRRQARLTHERERAAILERTADESTGRIATLERSLTEIETQLEALGDPDATYAALCEEKRRLLAEQGGARADRLEALQGELDSARGERRKLEKAVQSGKHVLGRLESMTRSLGRARGKSLASHGVGALPAVALNAVIVQGAKGSVRRVQDGFERFYEELNELDIAADDAFHDEIRRLIVEVGQLSADVGGRSTFSVMLDDGAARSYADSVDILLGHLEEKGKRLGDRVVALESEQQAIIESS